MKHILMVAYHYPPEASSSGVLRTLKFSKYLPQHGWTPHVLTLRESLYPVRDGALLKDVPQEVVVHRTWALDSSRHLAVRGRYLAALSVPDRFVSWLPFGFACGLRVIRQAGIQALYSTSPQPTAHLIAAALKLATGLPWVADFRDPWIEDGIYPRPGSARYRIESALESFVVRHASRVTVTTEHFRRAMLARYPDLSPDHVIAVFNGYDEEDFVGLGVMTTPDDEFEILHTGGVTPDFRDPFPLLRAVKSCMDRGLLDRERVRITFLGGGSYVSSTGLLEGVRNLGLGNIVRVIDRLSYRASLQRATGAAVLLLLQASDDTRCLIPAKAFEYLRSGRPILALTFEGATADLVRDCGRGLVVDPRNSQALESAVVTLYQRWRAGMVSDATAPFAVRRFERAALTAEFAAILDNVTGGTALGQARRLGPSTAPSGKAS